MVHGALSFAHFNIHIYRLDELFEEVLITSFSF